MINNTPIRMGLVGLGRAGWGMHCNEIASRAEKFQIVAVCDLEKDRLKRAAERYGCRTYRRIEDLIADAEVELVDLATRSPDHVPHAAAALKAGKYVYCEKPIACTMQQLSQLRRVATAGRGKGRLFIRHNRRFEPGFVHIREIIASNVLGEVYEIKLRRNGYQRRDDWQTIIKCGGGQLLNWGPHIIDHSLQFLESPVAGLWSDLKRVAALGDAEDHLKIVFKGQNGRIVDMEISGGAAISEPEYLIFGSRGALTASGNTIKLRYIDPKQKLPRRKARAATPPHEGGFGNPEVLNWVEQTLEVRPAGMAGMEILWDCLYDSIRQGKAFPIKLEEAMAVARVACGVKQGTAFLTT